MQRMGNERRRDTLRSSTDERIAESGPAVRGGHRVLAGAWVVACLLAVAMASSPARAQDGDTSVDIWVLDFKVKALRMYSPKSGPHKGVVYWYMLYELENKTGADREVFVSVQAESDGKKRYRDTFLPSVERGIERSLGKAYWGQTDRFKILKERDPSDPNYHYTTLEDGQKIQGIAVFNRIDKGADSIKIEIFGLSNDREEVDGEDGKRGVKERVRVFQFKRRGDEYEIDQDSFRKLGREWIKKVARSKR